ncbi:MULTISPECIES: DUF262 domain-containing protein [Streptomyces]|uniref:DUF262 domain-containing protein n=1 Tax=Streptomyces TaxID=1883 RepID=UPI00240D1DE0|nr:MULTISPECIES: DUF262 domain-containing protein [Streptomyces]WFB86816.1 DUF262 domain-containing protein [Streptomyces olivaceus]WGK46414.1 DUF262 domain-containing protein [Streptomyces sp. B146]
MTEQDLEMDTQAQESDLKNVDLSELDEDEVATQIDAYDIVASPNDFNTRTMNSFIEEGAIKIPPFQRNYVWDRKRASKLIESLILGLPVPQVFLYEEGNNDFLVIDGQQRLLTIFFFAKGRFPRKEKRSVLRKFFNSEGGISEDILQNDEYFETFKLSLPSLPGQKKNKFTGLTYKNLGEYKRQFDLRTLRNIIVKQTSPANDDSSMFEMFNRLNTGGVNLNPQEIRASLFHSEYFESIFELNQNEKWRELLGAPEPDARMKDIEVILRSLALREGIDGYAGSMTAFVNRFCKSSKRFKQEKINRTVEEWSWFLSRNKRCTRITYHAGSSRFSPLLFEAIYVASIALRDRGVDIAEIKPSWVERIGKDSKFAMSSHEGSTKTSNVITRLSVTESLLAELVGIDS